MKITNENFLSELERKNPQAIEYIVSQYGSLELFVRRYVKEQPMTQITAETGMERDLVYSRLSRGKKKIRSLFRERGGEYR